MTIPENVDFAAFYRMAKAKGIKVQSRFVGVHIFAGRSGLYFVAERADKHLGYFPFSKEGELAAKKAHDNEAEKDGLRIISIKSSRKRVA